MSPSFEFYSLSSYFVISLTYCKSNILKLITNNIILQEHTKVYKAFRLARLIIMPKVCSDAKMTEEGNQEAGIKLESK